MVNVRKIQKYGMARMGNKLVSHLLFKLWIFNNFWRDNYDHRQEVVAANSHVLNVILHILWMSLIKTFKTNTATGRRRKTAVQLKGQAKGLQWFAWLVI